jgi:iron complex transport system substrate-binding protein
MISRRTFLKTLLLSAAAAPLGGCGAQVSTRTVVDMAGRGVEVPETVSRVFCTNPIGTANLYMLAPEALVGWNFKPTGDAAKYFEGNVLSLPSLGVWMGAGTQANREEILAQAPDALLCWWTADEAGCEMADEIQGLTGLPTLVVDYSIAAVPEAFRFCGELTGAPARAEELASRAEELLGRIRQIAAEHADGAAPRIFLAQGLGGLTTDPVGSMHVTDALELMGMENVAELPGTVGAGMGMPTVNLEQVAGWDPDCVLVSEYAMADAESSDTYEEILSDAAWSVVPTVAEGRVWRIPAAPFSWFGRPPSAMRLLGCLWVMERVWGCGLDLAAETRAFFSAFLRIDDVDDETVSRLIGEG